MKSCVASDADWLSLKSCANTLGRIGFSRKPALEQVISLGTCKMSTSETINTGREKLDAWLKEKNYFTDALEKVEKKTGVKRIYLFLGNDVYNYASRVMDGFFPRSKIIKGCYSLFRFGWSIRSLSCVRLWSRSYSDSAWFCLSCLPIVSIF